MTESARVRIWIAAAALTLAAAGHAGAQAAQGTPASTQATDVFANTSSTTPAYQSQASSSCEETNNQHLAVDSPDPARCFNAVPAVNGQCSPIGGAESTLALQKGNLCYYCQQAPMPGKEIVLPIGAGLGMDSYQWMCTANPSAPACYLSCFGNFSFTPPPGVTLYPGNGATAPPSQAGRTTQPNGNGSKPPIKLQGYVSNTDPCYPAGPKNYYVCDYPNLPRPPGCTCSNTPPAQPPQQAQQPAPKPSGQPAAQPSDQTPDPNNYYLGMMVGISNCVQSFPMLGKGMGYFLVGQFDNAAAMWGIEPGQSMTLKDLSTPITGSNVTPFQQGVIAGQRICGYTAMHVAIKGTGYVAKALSGGDVPTLGKGTTGANEPGATGGKSAQPTEPTLNEPTETAGAPPEDRTVTNPPAEDKTITNPPTEDKTVTNPPAEDKTVNHPPAEDKTVSKPPADSAEPAPITGGESAADPVQGDSLKGALTNNKDNVSNARALGGKYVETENGPVELGNYIDEGTFAGVYEDGVTQVRKVAKNSGAGYFNEQLEGQSKGSDILKKLDIDHPEASDFVPGDDTRPATLVQENTGQKYPGSYGLSSGGFQKMPPATQTQVLNAIKSVIDKLASNGYILGDINPANFTIAEENGVLKAIIHDPDMIMDMTDLNDAVKDPTSGVGATLNGSLAASGAGPYTPGAYANAPALANTLYNGMTSWLKTGPPVQ